ncbi:MAG: phosphatidylglycerophosphatase A [Pseudomonadales bacterium]|jgi:phosphatidylglycerophosphatase A
MGVEVKRVFTHPLYFLALGFGSGLSKKAPGTMGTLVAVPLYLLIANLGPVLYSLVVLLALIAGIFICDWVARDMAVKDPGAIVWDEFVGLWIALFMLPEGWYWLLVGFLLFRFFDILKPWPVSYLDRELAGGMGIMMDDVAAGIYSLIILQLVAYSIDSLL